MNPLKKRQKLDDEQLEKFCKELDEIQEKVEGLDKEENDKVIELTREYNKLRKPHFQKRNEVIAKIPDFWITAFRNHPLLGGVLTEEDEEIFKYVTSMDVSDAEDVKSGYKITMTFKANPFFSNDTLSKEYTFNDEGEVTITTTKVDWKQTKAKEEGKKKGNKRTEPDEETLSFFHNWFEEEEEDELAEEIKENFWPNLVAYYHNVMDHGLEDDDEGDEEGEEGEEDEEEGDEEEEEK